MPFPGEDASVDDNLYPTLSVPTSLPVSAEEVLSLTCPFLRRLGQVYLYHVRDKDVRVCVENNEVRRRRLIGKEKKAGEEEELRQIEDFQIHEKDIIVVRGEEFAVVEAVTNPSMPYGMVQLRLDHPFSFSGHHVRADLLSPASARLQLGLVPEAFVMDFEPFTVDFQPEKQNCGRLSFTFSTLAFNYALASHRNPFSFC